MCGQGRRSNIRHLKYAAGLAENGFVVADGLTENGVVVIIVVIVVAVARAD